MICSHDLYDVDTQGNTPSALMDCALMPIKCFLEIPNKILESWKIINI